MTLELAQAVFAVDSNHRLDAVTRSGIVRGWATDNSLTRRMRLTELLDGARRHLTVGNVQGFYRDHAHAPHSLCAHPYPGRNL